VSFTIRPARRANVPLVIGLPGPSGGGKTYTALLLARGLAGDGKIVVVDTENGRSQMYADVGAPWEWIDFQAPFTPERYIEAIAAAEAHEPAVIVLDSISHEYEGDGGLFDIQEAYLQERAGSDERKRAALSFTAWNAAKIRHKRLLSKILRLRCHLIVCMRAQDKIELVKRDGKLEAIPKRTMTGVDGWEPICERRLPYELTASLLLLPSAPGVPYAIKLPEPLRALVPLDRPLSREVGAALAGWADPGQAPPDDTQDRTRDNASPTGAVTARGASGPAAPAEEQQTLAEQLVSREIVEVLQWMRREAGVDDGWLRGQLLEAGVDDVPEGRITLSTIKTLTKTQAGKLQSALNTAIDARREGEEEAEDRR
jgi:AAA domain